MRERIAIIGLGVSGLGCVYFLSQSHDLTLFDSDQRPGGHAHTIDVTEPTTGKKLPMDTGFMVFNEVTYPMLCRLFRQLGIRWKEAPMSFSVRHDPSGLEWCGSSLNHLFAQRRNLLRPRFWKLLWQINRFNKLAQTAWQTPDTEKTSLRDWCTQNRLGEDFLNLYLIPMSSAVWSTPPEKMLAFPAAKLMRFFYNHGFLGLNTQHQWLTPVGGSREYVQAILSQCPAQHRLGEPVTQIRRCERGVIVTTTKGEEVFDRVITACHGNQAFNLLIDADEKEKEILSAFQYNQNVATVHTDSSPMPQRRLAWSAWNYQTWSENDKETTSTHYWMNKLQGLTELGQFFVTINHPEKIASAKVIQKIPVEHPLFSLEALQAQGRVQELNERKGSRLHFVGAWQRYGFHEDGLWSAHRLCSYLLQRDAWE